MVKNLMMKMRRGSSIMTVCDKTQKSDQDRDFFQCQIFSETGSGTYFGAKFSPRLVQRLFWYQIFPIRVPIPSTKMKNSRDRVGTLSDCMMITVMMMMTMATMIIMIMTMMMKVHGFSTHQQPLASNQIGFWREFTPPHYVSGG